jgi:pimeloyl-ACP methyl ester carboxylesterase
VLLGHAAGGFVALHAALHEPDVFGGLILCNTAATLTAGPDPNAPTLLDRAGATRAGIVAGCTATSDESSQGPRGTPPTIVHPHPLLEVGLGLVSATESLNVQLQARRGLGRADILAQWPLPLLVGGLLPLEVCGQESGWRPRRQSRTAGRVVRTAVRMAGRAAGVRPSVRRAPGPVRRG